MTTHAQSAPAPTPAKKKRRQDCFTVRLSISVPLDLSKPESYAEAVGALAPDKLKECLPPGTVIDVISQGLNKL